MRKRKNRTNIIMETITKKTPIWQGVLLAIIVGFIVYYVTPKPLTPNAVIEKQKQIDTVQKQQQRTLIEAETNSYEQVKKADKITKRAKVPIVIKDTTDAYIYEYITNYKYKEYE